MPLARAFFNTFLDALFPIPPAERAVLAMDGPTARKALPRAPFSVIPEACSLFAYKDERVSRLIWSIKYKKSRIGASIAGYGLYSILKRFIPAMPINMKMVIVPMPITRARRRERDYNQCDLILDEIEKLDVNKQLLFARRLIKRVRHTSRQTKKDRVHRLESIHNVFEVDEAEMKSLLAKNEGRNYFILVIDDVITTGTTIKDAIQTIRRAGLENAWGMSVAH